MPESGFAIELPALRRLRNLLQEEVGLAKSEGAVISMSSHIVGVIITRLDRIIGLLEQHGSSGSKTAAAPVDRAAADASDEHQQTQAD